MYDPDYARLGILIQKLFIYEKLHNCVTLDGLKAQIWFPGNYVVSYQSFFPL